MRIMLLFWKSDEDKEAITNEELNESKVHPFNSIIESTPKFLTLFDQIDDLFQEEFDDVYLEFYNQLENRTKECDVLLSEVSQMKRELIASHNKKIILRSTTA